MGIFSSLRSWLYSKQAGRLALKTLDRCDAEAAASIHRQSFSRYWTDGEIAKLIADPKNLALGISRSQRAPICAFIIIQRVVSAGEAEVLTIAVDISWQGLGLGRRLLDEAIRQLQSDHLESLFLEVDENNTRAFALYRRLGFQKVGERKGYYTNDSKQAGTKISNALVMKLILG